MIAKAQSRGRIGQGRIGRGERVSERSLESLDTVSQSVPVKDWRRGPLV